MKSIITNYWRKILVAIGGFFIFINVIMKIFAKKVLLSDYIKYGKDIKSTSSIVGGGSGNINASEVPIEPGILKLGIILMVGILLVIFITSIADSSSTKAKKK